MLDALARLFLQPAPADDAPRWLPPEASAPVPSATRLDRVGVVCAPRDARVAGGAAALALGVPAPTVLEWTGAEPVAAPDRTASPAARRAAAGLRERGACAAAAGRLVRVLLPAAEPEAAEAALAAAGSFVLVACGPRGAAMERALGACDRILLVARPDADEALTTLATDELARLAPCTALVLPRSPGAAALARSGAALAAPLRGPFVSALGARP